MGKLNIEEQGQRNPSIHLFMICWQSWDVIYENGDVKSAYKTFLIIFSS